MSTYVVGVDGSDTAAKAARVAGDLATATGATIHVVCAYSGHDATSVKVGSESYVISSMDTAQQIAEQQAAAYRAAGVEATFASVDGKPSDVLLGEAERLSAALIVVGNRRMQGLGRLLGAVANDVVHQAPCDVLLVKTV